MLNSKKKVNDAIEIKLFKSRKRKASEEKTKISHEVITRNGTNTTRDIPRTPCGMQAGQSSQRRLACKIYL